MEDLCNRYHSNKFFISLFRKALIKNKVNKDYVQFIDYKSRKVVDFLLTKMANFIDVIIPRGGKGLVKLITEESRVPVIKHLDGICHVYIDETADFEKAIDIAFNAKTYRYGICGAMETLLLHKKVAKDILPRLNTKFLSEGVELRGCKETLEIISVIEASEEDWSTEYLEAIISVKIVDGVEEAISHISEYSTNHTDSIITEDNDIAEKFML